jgi:hypothetical protein
MLVKSSVIETRGYGLKCFVDSMLKRGGGGGSPVLVDRVYNKHKMLSKMGESQHSAVSFRRDRIGASSVNRFRLLLLLACYL